MEKTELEAAIELEMAEESAPPKEEKPEETPEETPGETDEEPGDEKITGFQKRINKRTADYYREKRERERLEQELAELKSKGIAQPVSEKPSLEKFDYDEDQYREALIEWQVENKLGKTLESRRKETEKESFNRQINEFADKVRKANIPDYDEVVYSLAENVRLPYEVLSAIHQDEKGPEIMVYLGKNLDIAEDLSRLSPIQAGRKLGEISGKLSAKQTKRTTKAPDPVETAGSGGSAATTDLDKLSMDEFMKLDL